MLAETNDSIVNTSLNYGTAVKLNENLINGKIYGRDKSGEKNFGSRNVDQGLSR